MVHRGQGGEQNRQEQTQVRWVGEEASMEMGWTGGHQEQHVKQKFGVMATAYPKCQCLRVAVGHTKSCSREQSRNWG